MSGAPPNSTPTNTTTEQAALEAKAQSQNQPGDESQTPAVPAPLAPPTAESEVSADTPSARAADTTNRAMIGQAIEKIQKEAPKKAAEVTEKPAPAQPSGNDDELNDGLDEGVQADESEDGQGDDAETRTLQPEGQPASSDTGKSKKKEKPQGSENAEDELEDEDQDVRLTDHEILLELEKKVLGETLAVRRKHFFLMRNVWYGFYLTLLSLSIIFSVGIAFILESDFLGVSSSWAHIAAGLTFVAAILITLSAMTRSPLPPNVSFVAAALNVAIVVLLKLERDRNTIPLRDWLVGLGLVSAALTILYAVLNNQRVWENKNRKLTEIEQLEFDLTKKDADLIDIRRRLKATLNQLDSAANV